MGGKLFNRQWIMGNGRNQFGVSVGGRLTDRQWIVGDGGNAVSRNPWPVCRFVWSYPATLDRKSGYIISTKYRNHEPKRCLEIVAFLNLSSYS